jgi:NADH dehydrogenase/NADH:ubiquinone oxidoreductase subunit G
MISLTIDSRKIEVEKGITVLDAARQANIHIPTLCYLPEVQAIGGLQGLPCGDRR